MNKYELRVKFSNTQYTSKSVSYENIKFFTHGQTCLFYIELSHEPAISKLIQKFLDDWKIILLPIEQWWPPQITQYTWVEKLWKWWMLVDENTLPYEWPIDIALIPWLAFDESGVRLGHWWGWYDKLLSNYHETYKVWVCYQEQVLERWIIPIDKRDIVMDEVLVI